MTRALCSLRDWEVEWRGLGGCGWGGRPLLMAHWLKCSTIFANVKHVRSKTFPFHIRTWLFWCGEKFWCSAIEAPRQYVLEKTVHSEMHLTWGSAGEEEREGFQCKGIVIIYDNGFPRPNPALLSEVQHTAELWNVSSECTAGHEKWSPTRKRTKSKDDQRWRQHER